MKNFKLFLILILAVSAIMLSMSSCSPDTDVELDQNLLIGKWQETNTLNFEVYGKDGSGYTWDEADDVTEAEAQPFTWGLNGNVLTQVHTMEMGGNVPKAYTVTKLTATELVYEDNYGKVHSFDKIPW
jgi:hypothetical protein